MKLMLRSFRPYLLLASLIGAVIGLAYVYGAPVWSVYLAIAVGELIPITAYVRWDIRHHG